MTEKPVGCFFDTNILLRLANRQDPAHHQVSSVVAKLADRADIFYISLQVAAEFWNVFTRPTHHNGLGGSAAEAHAQLNAFTSAMTVLPETADSYSRWLSLVATHDVQGAKVHDARIASLLQVHGVSCLLTQNARDFARYDGFAVLTPSALDRS